MAELFAAAPHPAAPAAQDAFAADYAAARSRFLAAAATAEAAVESFAHPLTGPSGEALATDTAWLGPADAGRVLVLQSATHGVEGFCGAGIQTDLLRAAPAPRLPPDTALLLIHALNPHGFAWLRRVNEDGVDLNRNFVDFAGPLPANAGYEALADALVPPATDAATLAAADAALAAYAADHGQRALEEVVTAGQHTHADGLFHGGTGPTWSRRTLESILARHRMAERRSVAVIDLHTGLGPYGYGELICDHPPGSAAVARARAWWGVSVTEPLLGTSSSGAKTGLVDYAWHAVGPQVVFVTLEVGTFPTGRMFEVLRADHVLHRTGAVDWQAPETRRIKAALRRHFYPDADDWREQVLWRSRQVVRQALAGLVAAG
ncbi:M14 family metallopeptidase [Caenispirillum bisanense]|uniref:Zinc carboxypeptidase n=1 Tax=Caenispirillum bisanense TaxID=414052 RepID=A0A286GE61_9PROT|nr:M14 family metallopeptidase [Caenispirillum bisanense]SOD93815.1 Protein of unknown function [Caenispirillum bisanense]